MRLCIRVSNSDVPCQRFAFGPREQGSAVRAFIVLPHQADWLLDCGDLCSFDGSPDNVVVVKYAFHHVDHNILVDKMTQFHLADFSVFSCIWNGTVVTYYFLEISLSFRRCLYYGICPVFMQNMSEFVSAAFTLTVYRSEGAVHQGTHR